MLAEKICAKEKRPKRDTPTIDFLTWREASDRGQLGESIWDKTTEKASRRRHPEGETSGE